MLAAATIHVASLGATLNSSRGVAVISEIYGRLATRGHEIHLLRVAGKVVGGIVTQVHDRPSGNVDVLFTAPTSWLAALHSLGPWETFAQFFDLARLKVAANKTAPHDYILALYVDEPHRKHGFAQRLVDVAIRSATGRGTGVMVDTYLTNSAARRLYEKAGFIEQYRTSRSVLLSHCVE